MEYVYLEKRMKKFLVSACIFMKHSYLYANIRGEYFGFFSPSLSRSVSLSLSKINKRPEEKKTMYILRSLQINSN